MICSISTNNESTSNWLDRLRSSRGFPTGDHLDLDHYLTIRTADSPETAAAAAANNNSSSNSNNNAHESAHSETAQCMGNAVSHVLCELFCMGDVDGISRKKSSRKQQNPKFCDVKASKNETDSSSNELKREKSENNLASSGGDNCDGGKTEGNVDSVVNVEEDESDDGEEENGDLKEYSRSDVTVIDTSLEEWKVQRLVFRRKNVWKVGEKRRWNNCGGKKRKGGNLVGKDRGENSGGLTREMKGDGLVVPPNEAQSQDDVRLEPPCKEVADGLRPTPINRAPLSSSSKKLKITGSPVILVKAIPTDDPSVSKKLGKSSFKQAPKQLKSQKSEKSESFQEDRCTSQDRHLL
ncbi:hypothetical protein Ancab_010084 [Ancistrocladus abbreviatus]